MNLAVRSLAATAFAAASLTGCAAPPPETMQSDANQIALRWYRYEHSFSDAEHLAEAHCGSLRKRAVLTEDWTDRDVEIARFACR